MIEEATYSTDTNGIRTVNKSANIRSLSLIRHHGRVKFDLARENTKNYLQQSTQLTQV